MSKKMRLTASEVKNMINMFKSTDEENHHIAFQIVENCEIKESTDAILILHKFSNISPSIWKKEAPKAIKYLEDQGILTPNGASSTELLTMPGLFNKLLKVKADKSIMQEFIRLHNEYLVSVMNSWGYPMDNFTVEIKLKEDVQ
jgi:hypothetical protein